MNIDMLRAIGKAETKLARVRVDMLKEKLQEFAGDPEVDKALDYMNRFNMEIPETHPVFKMIEEMKTQRDSQKLLEKGVKPEKEDLTQIKDSWAKRDKQALDEDKAEAEKEKIKNKIAVDKVSAELNLMLDNLERENDKIFEFLSKNQKVLSKDLKKVACALKTRRFLVTMKNGFKTARIN